MQMMFNAECYNSIIHDTCPRTMHDADDFDDNELFSRALVTNYKVIKLPNHKMRKLKTYFLYLKFCPKFVVDS